MGGWGCFLSTSVSNWILIEYGKLMEFTGYNLAISSVMSENYKCRNLLIFYIVFEKTKINNSFFFTFSFFEANWRTRWWKYLKKYTKIIEWVIPQFKSILLKVPVLQNGPKIILYVVNSNNTTKDLWVVLKMHENRCNLKPVKLFWTNA